MLLDLAYKRFKNLFFIEVALAENILAMPDVGICFFITSHSALCQVNVNAYLEVQKL